MKVSFYELLGMIKEGKQPNKVVYEDRVYVWSSKSYETCGNITSYLTNQLHDNELLEKNITILESNEKVKEKDKYEYLELLTCDYNDYISKSINKLIKNQKKIIDKLKEMEENK